MRLGIGLLLTVLAAPVMADDVDSAFKLCDALESSGVATECDVSGWGKSVDVRMVASGSGARTMCHAIVKLASDTVPLSPGWTLKIFSPYSGDHVIAKCNLS